MSTYHFDDLKIHSRLYKTEEMSLMSKIWMAITILAGVELINYTIHMPVKWLVGAAFALLIVMWLNWID